MSRGKSVKNGKVTVILTCVSAGFADLPKFYLIIYLW